MSVVVLCTNQEELKPLARFAYRFARVKNRELRILIKGFSDPGLDEAIHELADEDSREKAFTSVESTLSEDSAFKEPYEVEISTRELDENLKPEEVLRQISKESPSLLIVAKREGPRESADSILAKFLYERAPIDTLLIRLGESEGKTLKRLLIPTAGGRHADEALRLGKDLAEITGGELHPLYVERYAGEIALTVGKRILDGILERVGISEAPQVKPRVQLSYDINQGISSVLEEGYDLLLMGASDKGSIRELLFGTVPNRLVSGQHKLAVAVLRRAWPLKKRIQLFLERILHMTIPQLERQDRVQLFERLQLGSRWNFDFAALISLSTAIAAMGLLQNSAAVVIGAMLVAPLMTPLLGAGLSIVQGNFPLFRQSAIAIALGFLAALLIGCLTGFAVPLAELTAELRARGGPSLLDMGIAFLSGIAAAYCVGRPTLSAALPGVAIAAALVPPIASAGISLSLGEFDNAQGASLLFGTNVVAIILGSALAFFCGGVRSAKLEKGLIWRQYLLIGLVLVLTALAVPLGSAFYSSFYGGSPQIVVRSVVVEPELRERIRKVVEDHLGLTLGALRWSAEPLQIGVGSPRPLKHEEAKLIQKAAAVPIRVSTRLELKVPASGS